MTSGRLRVLVLFHSRTGTSARLARDAARLLSRMDHDPVIARLAPRRDLPYFLWLLLSFLPGARFPLADPLPDPSGFDALLIVFPKWTFGDPVINRFLADAPEETPPAAFLVACGGWDAERYAKRYAERRRSRGKVLGTEIFLRKEVGTPTGEARLAMCLRKWF